MKKYLVEITRTSREKSAHDEDTEKRFLTAAGLLRYARKIAEHYPKDARIRYAFFVAHGGKKTEIFNL